MIYICLFFLTALAHIMDLELWLPSGHCVKHLALIYGELVHYRSCNLLRCLALARKRWLSMLWQALWVGDFLRVHGGSTCSSEGGLRSPQKAGPHRRPWLISALQCLTHNGPGFAVNASFQNSLAAFSPVVTVQFSCSVV